MFSSFSAYLPQSIKHVTMGRCSLSDRDKLIQPDAFRAAPYDEEYIENQCNQRVFENDNCSYELYSNSSFIYAEAQYRGISQKECQAKCTYEKRFFCQGVSFYLIEGLNMYECLLHSEDIISMGPRSLRPRKNSVYMRRVKCLDVQVLCTADEMVVKYTPQDWFMGKMYANMHSQECMVYGNGSRSTELRLSIGSEIRESRCGILRAYERTKEYQRTFISTLLVIQNNPKVQTQGDRLIKVGCIVSNATTTNEQNSSSKTDFEAAKETTENVPSTGALESAVGYAQHLPSEGSLLVNVSDSLILPKVYLQIIDLSHAHKTKDVKIGQSLELQIVAEYSPLLLQKFSTGELPPLHDFRATSLIAKTADKRNFVTLIDENGCPTDPAVFPAFERRRGSTQNTLQARFHAFKFAGSSVVTFDVKIRFCEHVQCPPSNCLPSNSDEQMIETFSIMGRRRRQLSSVEEQQQYTVHNPVYISTVMDVDKFNNSYKHYVAYAAENAREPKLLNLTHLNDYNTLLSKETLPLNYDLRVRGPDISNGANSFIYGERGMLLIAGIDSTLNMENICLNQSLFIAILIFWLIFQVLVFFGCFYLVQKYRRLSALEEERRKYQENLDYLESRRVRWADEGGFTL